VDDVGVSHTSVETYFLSATMACNGSDTGRRCHWLGSGTYEDKAYEGGIGPAAKIETYQCSRYWRLEHLG
jgi:hypothetical protein